MDLFHSGSADRAAYGGPMRVAVVHASREATTHRSSGLQPGGFMRSRRVLFSIFVAGRPRREATRTPGHRGEARGADFRFSGINPGATLGRRFATILAPDVGAIGNSTWRPLPHMIASHCDQLTRKFNGGTASKEARPRDRPCSRPCISCLAGPVRVFFDVSVALRIFFTVFRLGCSHGSPLQEGYARKGTRC